MADVISFPGTVEWSGENPGITLKDTPDGPFVTAELLPRVPVAARARHALMLMNVPRTPPAARRAIFCSTPRKWPLIRLGFVSHFGPGDTRDETWSTARSTAGASGDPGATIARRESQEFPITLSWNASARRSALRSWPDKSATGTLERAPSCRQGRERGLQRQDAARQAGAARDCGIL